jgi:hypothetical protein
VDDTTAPTAMFSLGLPERGMQVFVTGGPSKKDVVMEVSYEPPGSFKYAARLRRSAQGPVVEAVTVSVKPDARQIENVLLDRKVLAAVPLAELLRGAQHALGWDLESWGNAIKRWPPPPKGQPYPDEHYWQVAEAYRAAVAAGQPPRPFIHKTWGFSEATVSRWIRTARQKNMLEPAPKSVGGRPPRAN